LPSRGFYATGETRKRGSRQYLIDRPVSWVPVLELPFLKQEAFRIPTAKTIAFVMMLLEILRV
jgi:hypothetical protein